MNELAELKQIVLDLKVEMDKLKITMPTSILLVDFAQTLSISRQTLRYYVTSNFEPQVDFYKKNNRIYLDVSILLSLKEHYAK